VRALIGYVLAFVTGWGAPLQYKDHTTLPFSAILINTSHQYTLYMHALCIITNPNEFPHIKAQVFIFFPAFQTQPLNEGGLYSRPGVYFQ